jgi:RNA polymerase sigma factor (sigma-70 family)
MIMTVDPSESHSLAATRASLLARITNPADDASWREFYQHYKNLVFGFACRSGLSRADAEEVAQDVFNRVSQTIQDFDSDPNRGTFRGWLRNLTRWRVTDKLRERQRLAKIGSASNRKTAEDPTPAVELIADPMPDNLDSLWEAEWELRVLETALSRVRGRVDARHFQVFELITRQGKDVAEISRHLEMNRATIYVIRHRLKKMLVAEVKKLRTELD